MYAMNRLQEPSRLSAVLIDLGRHVCMHAETAHLKQAESVTKKDKTKVQFNTILLNL